MVLAALMAFSCQSYAVNEIHMNVPIAKGLIASKWSSAPSEYSSWVDTHDAPVCTLWAPDPSTIVVGTAFVQTSSDCQQNQQRTAQAREKNSITQAYRNVGAPHLEYQAITVSQTRSATGSYVDPGVWTIATSIVSGWTNVGTPTACTNWSPAPSTITNGQSFQQTATDCQQAQQRTVQAREQNSISHDYRNLGSLQQENHAITVSQIRSAVGTYIDPGVWTTATSIVSAWTDVGTPTACTNWSPDPLTITSGQAFQQTATDCQQAQQRTVQAREQNSISHDYRNVGSLQQENHAITVSQTRSAVGTRVEVGVWTTTTPVVSAWTNVGTFSGCSNWSPATSVIYTGTSFQQTATNCQQVQERTSQAREQNSVTSAYRDVGSPQTQTQTVSVSSTRTATGTSIYKTVQVVTKNGSYQTQKGYMPSISQGSILSTTDATYGFNYLTIGYQGYVFLGIAGYSDPSKVQSITVEILDANDNVLRVVTGTNPVSVGSPYIGIPTSGADVTAAYASDKYRLTVQFK